MQEVSLERITKADLHRLATLALDYFDDLFKRRRHQQSPATSGTK